MSNIKEFNKVTGKQIAVCVFFILLACFLESSIDYINSLNEPSLTFGDIVIDTVGIAVIVFILGLPIAKFFWNYLLSTIFSIPKINYTQSLVIVTCIYWIGGI
jgi:hypothetical protein